MSPAGYWPQLRAAIGAGADAVYFGLKHFSARAKVGFALEELPDVMRTLHGRGVRGYVTFNTLIFEHELLEAARTGAAIVEAGADALIIQDLGILRLMRDIAPDVELHASTQMSITDAEGVRFAQSYGADRVTLARELSIAEVQKIYEQTGCPLEMFVHGALCVCGLLRAMFFVRSLGWTQRESRPMRPGLPPAVRLDGGWGKRAFGRRSLSVVSRRSLHA